MASQNRQNFQQRAGSGMPGRVRRALDGGVESFQRYGNTTEVVNGKVETKAARGGGLLVTDHGLMLDPAKVGEKNRPELNFIRDLSSSASTADVIEKLNELLAELRRTSHMRR